VNPPQRRINIPGWAGIACQVFMWLEMLAPKSMTVLSPVLNRLGPLYWLVPLAMIVLPTLAAKNGSKWWLCATATAIVTFVVFLRIVLD
jgi:Mn2+/Fe2+ NRAMP family transporter